MTTIDGYNIKQFERSDVPTYEHVGYADSRVTAYIAFPVHTTTLAEESDILWWAKTHSEPEWWTDNCKSYKIYRIYIKERYLHHVTEELRQINGSYLRRTISNIGD